MKPTDVKKAWCFFEQSGTFKNVLIKEFGIPSCDVDIQNEYGQTDMQLDLFLEIEKAWRGEASLFDVINSNDLILAFFPCIYFTKFKTIDFCGYKWQMKDENKIPYMLDQLEKRKDFHKLLLKLVDVVQRRSLRMIIENPYSEVGYLMHNFFPPTIVDRNRRARGDCFQKPTAYWFYGFKPTTGLHFAPPPMKKVIEKTRQSKIAGVCSKERSEITPIYAKNFLLDFVFGSNVEQLNLFEYER